MKKLFGLLLIILIFISCSSNYKQKKFRDKYMFSVELGKSNFTENISYSDVMGLMIIPVEIEGKTYNFLFDTGAITLVSSELKHTLSSAKNNIDFQIEDSGGNIEKADFSILPKITIGSVDFLNVGTSVADLSHFQELCVHIDGIIGANLMRAIFWKIDFANNTISFSDNKENIQIHNPAIIFPLGENFNGSPQSQLKWAQYDFWTMWDTGYNGSLQIVDSIFFNGRKYQSMPLVSGKKIDLGTLYGKEKNIEERYITLLDSIVIIREWKENRRFVGNLFKNQNVEIAPYPAYPLIGTKFMETADEILFDWKNKQIEFKKMPSSEPKETFGFAPYRNRNVVQVATILDNSEAQRKGLQIGDTIVSINDKNISNIPQELWCQEFSAFEKDEKNKDSISITVKKGNENRKITLSKYSLFSE